MEIDEKVTELIFQSISGFQLILGIAVVSVVIYLLVRKIKIEKKEDFTRRDN